MRLLLLLLLLAAPLAAAQPRALADSLLAPFDRPDAPGASVAVVRGGAVVYERAVGMADLSHGVAFTPATPSNIGSTSKQFTGYAVARLAAEGRLSLEDDVRDHLPELPDLGATVTLRHLLTHTSGYREFLNALAMAGVRLDEGDAIDGDAALRVVRRQRALQNEPGAEWSYNNSGYALLSRVVEAATGEPFDAWMAAHVFAPAGMATTQVRMHPGAVVPGAARGYLPHGEDAFREGEDIGGAPGAGGIYATAGDLARWMIRLGEGLAAGDGVYREMATPYVLASGDTTAYGLGLFVDRERGQRRIHHGGADLAHRADFAYYPDLDGGVVVLTNHPGFPLATAVRDLVDAFFGAEMEPLAEGSTPVAADPAAFAPEAFDRFAGRYALEVMPSFILTFWREDEQLWTQATGQPRIEIVATSDTTFSLVGVEAHLTFHADAAGAVTGLTLHQNGHHAARRLEDPAEGPDLDAFAGLYFSDELEAAYVLRSEDGALHLHHSLRDPLALTPGEGDAFAGPFPFLEVQFERDGDGRVRGFHASNGRTRGVWFERYD